MNKELVNNLRLESGIARLADWDNALICVSREGNVIDPLEGIEILVKAVVEECISVVEDQFWSDPYEVYQAIEIIKKHFGVKND